MTWITIVAVKPGAVVCAEMRVVPPCARMAAFCAPGAPEVFQSIVYQPQIWLPDPYDVETIHADAREAFTAKSTRSMPGKVVLQP